MDWTLIVVAGIGLLGSGVVGGFIGARANAAKAISEAVVNLITPLNSRVAALTKRVAALEKENRGLRLSVEKLLDLIRRMWAVICENNLDVDPDLIEAVCEALEDSAT